MKMTLMRAGSSNFICKTVVVLMLIFSCYGMSIAQAATFEEPDVKAAFLYYFFHFISWPERASGPKDQPFEFCSLNNGPVINALELVLASPKAAKTVVRISKISDPEKISGCDYVFIGSASEEYARDIIAATHGRAILTVSDIDGFTSMGGMIELKRSLNRVNVLVNVELLTAQGLKASSKLLNLATIISTPQNEDQR